MRHIAKRYILAAVLGVLALGAFAVGAQGEAETVVVIYGSDSCGLCVALREELAEANIPYEFYDVWADDAALREVERLSRDESWWAGEIRTPTVAIGDELYVRPTLEEVLAAIEAE